MDGGFQPPRAILVIRGMNTGRARPPICCSYLQQSRQGLNCDSVELILETAAVCAAFAYSTRAILW